MDRSWVYARLFSNEHIDGVKQFMSYIEGRVSENVEILCPCARCLNQKYFYQPLVRKHLLLNGMDSTYTRWIHHGESIDVDVIEHPNDMSDNAGGVHGEDVIEDDRVDRLEGMLGDLRTAAEEEARGDDGENQDDGDREPTDQESFLKIVMREAKRQLYPGCTKYSRFTFVVQLLHMKSMYRVSNSAFSAILKLLAKALPECNTLPTSYDAAKNLLKELGLGYVSIHVCYNNCVLFRNEYAKHDNCPICGLSRWKDPERKKIPQKVLRHFPLAPRLKRMFGTKEASEEAQWHKLKRQPSEKEMSHPADGKAWEDFDKEFPDFGGEARNIRLGLATDGFNPFSEQNTKYSMWPVFVVPYNFPPWACMEESNFMMALLIPGPDNPGKDFDLFLEPLVEDLLELWKGVPTYDARARKMFKLRAAVLWCIHDYPALSTLSGRTTKGYFACTHCDKDPLSYRLRSKIGYIGHYRFLPEGHRLRRNNEFAGLHESNDPPAEFSAEELLAELEKVKDVRPGKPQGGGKRKRSDLEGGRVRNIWSRMVSLWKLPYWHKLKLRHNLDVMHIEKNICESLIATILNIIRKTKDTVKARLDLKDLGIRKELQLSEDGGSCRMPHARYTLSKEQKKAFCDFIREIKFPDGFASNISRCLNADGTKLQCLKSHDCHILLQRILPVAMRGFLDKDIYEAIAELGKIFRELCSRTLNKDVLAEMKKEIPIILVKLEKIFPPAFFDVMVHLAVHLPDEALLRGPVQYGWMYPIERRLYTLKRYVRSYVRNRARPEGSIAEAYIVDECLTFCSKYMDDVETRFNREPRNKGFSNEEAYDVDVFGHGVHFTSAPELVYDENGFNQMVWFVLNNCSQVDNYVEMFREELERQGVPNIERTLQQGFQSWFRNHIMNKRNTGTEEVDDDLFSLACGPDFRVKKYSSCIVNGVRFNTVDRDSNKKTQNSGVMSQSTHNGQSTDFFGTLKEIIQLDYHGEDRSAVLFKCDWFKLDGKRTALNDDGFFKSINVGRQTQAVALSEYEKQRLSNCMQNNTRLQQLGIPALSLMFAKAATGPPDKNKSAQRNAEESDSDYDPSRDGDGTGEQDLIDGNAKGSKEKTPYMPPGGGVVKFKNRKRVFAAEPCTRLTRSKKTITKAVPSVNQTAELSGTYDECTQAAIEDDGIALPDDNAHTTDNTGRHSHMVNQDDTAQHGDENENATMAAGVRDLTHGDENENATMAAGDRNLTHPDDKMTAAGRQGIRRGTMGHGLERMS